MIIRIICIIGTNYTCLKTILCVVGFLAGCEDGRVQALNTKTNKSQHLYGTDSVAVSLAANEQGTGFLCGHDDGIIMRFYISNNEDVSSGKIVQHHSSPVALAWANGHIIAAGCDRKVAFYDAQVKYDYIT